MLAAKIFSFKGGGNLKKSAPKISVIVPMYNAEKYLKLCLNSILEQTFRDFELILIDDCSTDKTLEIAKSFKDSRIKILRNEKNLGMPGAVRNVGIDAAKGEYIYFCDDDDIILANGLEILYTTAKKNNADVVNTTKRYHSAIPNDANSTNILVNIIQNPPAQPVSPDLKTRIYQEFLLSRMHIAPWLFLYRREFLKSNNIKFPAEVAEDVFFNFDVVCSTSKIIKIDEPFYIWRCHQESATYNIERVGRNIKSIIELDKHIEEKLLPLNDFAFTQMVLNYWTNHVIGSYILPFINNQSTDVLIKMFEALTPYFEKNSSFVMTLLQLYIQMRLMNVTVNEENRKLKIELENIQKKIEQVTKD